MLALKSKRSKEEIGDGLNLPQFDGHFEKGYIPT